MKKTIYGILIEEQPKHLQLFAQLDEDITIGGVLYPAGSMLFVANKEDISKWGLKPVVFTDNPVREGYYYIEKWKETAKAIIQVWEEHEQGIEEENKEATEE